jgi:hypothetical protein
MMTVRIVVDKIEAEQKNSAGGRTITIDGRTTKGEVGVCALTFPTAASLEELRAAIDARV